MRVTRWWESPTGPLRAEGEGLCEPAKGCRIMQVDGAALDAELARRADKHGQPVGIEITEHVGVAGLEAAGLLRGAWAMARRVYGAEDWYVSWDGADIDALYDRRRATRFVVARRAAGAPTWRSHGGTDDDDDEEDVRGSDGDNDGDGDDGGGGGGNDDPHSN